MSWHHVTEVKPLSNSDVKLWFLRSNRMVFNKCWIKIQMFSLYGMFLNSSPAESLLSWGDNDMLSSYRNNLNMVVKRRDFRVGICRILLQALRCNADGIYKHSYSSNVLGLNWNRLCHPGGRDIQWWRHDMETLSVLLVRCEGNH